MRTVQLALLVIYQRLRRCLNTQALLTQCYYQPAQHPLAFWRQRDTHGPPVRALLVLAARHQAARLRAIHQPDYGVMPDLQSLGKLADVGPLSTGKPLDGQQQVIVLGSEADLVGLELCLPDELPQRVAEVGQLLVFAG